jgi:hypothetical protein
VAPRSDARPASADGLRDGDAVAFSDVNARTQASGSVGLCSDAPLALYRPFQFGSWSAMFRPCPRR